MSREATCVSKGALAGNSSTMWMIQNPNDNGVETSRALLLRVFAVSGGTKPTARHEDWKERCCPTVPSGCSYEGVVVSSISFARIGRGNRATAKPAHRRRRHTLGEQHLLRKSDRFG